MSTVRRTSTKQGLQDLLWVMTQRSLEDAEEIEREQRQRARLRQSGQTPCSSAAPIILMEDSALPPGNAVCDTNLKPHSHMALEEDEGYSDGTQRLAKRKQHRQEEQDYKDDHRPKHNETSKTNQITNCNEDKAQIHGETEEKNNCEISFTSKEYMPHDTRHLETNDQFTEATSSLVVGTINQGSSLSDHCGVDGEDTDAFLDTEQSPERIGRSHARKKEFEEPKTLQDQQEQDERYMLRVEDEPRQNEKEQHRQILEEEERLEMREGVENRMKTTEKKSKSLSVSCNEEEEPFNLFCPMGPTFKKLLIQFYPEVDVRMTPNNTYMISEQKETLNRSLLRSNNPKKTLSGVITRIDNRLEQYTHAIASSSKEINLAKHVFMDLPSPPEPVAMKKNLFEAGEAWGQNLNKAALSKEIKPGDVLNKKNLWENLGDRSSGIKKGMATNKKYKFVVNGHGKYEKNEANFKNGKSDGLSKEDV